MPLDEEEGEKGEAGKQIDLTGCQGLTETVAQRAFRAAKCVAQRLLQIP